MKFGKLTVIKLTECIPRKPRGFRKKWLCQCECGNIKNVYGDNLTCGNTISCGCHQKKMASNANTIHGRSNSRLYAVWSAIKRRCYSESSSVYHRYGGRGIYMCDEWVHDFEAFQTWALKTGYDPNAPRGACTIDRIDNNGHYCPENCRWVNQREQMNNVSYNHLVTYRRETHTIAEWARIFEMRYDTFYSLIAKYDFDIEKAFENN